MQILSDPEHLESATIRELFTYWKSKCSNGNIPRRRDIDPLDLTGVLPNVIMLDFEQNPFRARFRLVGTRVVEVTGFEFTGMYLDEIAMPDVEDSFQDCYQTASETMKPVFTRITWRFDEKTTGDYDFCVLPLESDGSVATMAIAAECYARLEKKYSLGALRSLAANAMEREL